ncbi:MAG: thiamine pyrophosphate-dependent enzyme [Candidatus Krumholzibacteria bacterium]|nr:thiamine pyrophosphate-dependent enzyme [Candidatus Krumholzibacteria bacterium]
MFGLKSQCVLDFEEEYRTLDDYQGRLSRWCPGCGDNGILSATQRLCRDEQLPPEKTVFVSGIGCAARFPHYMNTYGFHGLHGRALPTAQGVRIRRPDLHVFVNMGDGDCCSIGTAHWIHAVRMNMNMVAMLHDNNIYGLTKKQVSPTTPQGIRTNTTPSGAYLRALNPLSATLGVTNVSFVAQVVEWIPDLLYEVIKKAFHHKGFSFIRILQRCPHFLPDLYSSLLSNPDKLLLLRHDDGMEINDTIGRVYKNHEEHDPSNLNRAREIAEMGDMVPVGILYRNESVARYEDLRKPQRMPTWEQKQERLERAFDMFGIFPEDSEVSGNGNGEGS